MAASTATYQAPTRKPDRRFAIRGAGNVADVALAFRRSGRLLPPLLLTGCEGIQSSLSPRGADAESYFILGNVMFAAAGIIFALVLAITAMAALRPDRLPFWLKGHALILGAGLAFPVVALSALLIYGLLLTRQGNAGDDATMRTIEVTAHQFWWRVRYLTPQGEVDFETANELHLPVGQEVRLMLKSADVIHSFWIPSLAGKIDMIPGRTTVLYLSASQEGLYRGQCAEFCGLQHANMALYARAVTEGEFSDWLIQQREAASLAGGPAQTNGLSVFRSSGCGACHTIRGTDATGTAGPDLTHIGSRHSIGAGILPRNIGTIAGWIAGNQHIKPGNPMPAYDTIGAADLRALAGYLEGLR